MARPPRTFHEFIGQPGLVARLAQLIRGARQRGEPTPSCLLVGPPGVGKTSLAQAVATEYGSNLHVLFAGTDTRSTDVCTILHGLAHGDVFFIDEGHSLKPDAQESLYRALDENKAFAVCKGRLDRSCWESVANFTLLVATTEPGVLKPALRNRLVHLVFEPYSLAELKAIAERHAHRKGTALTAQAARRIAEMARGTPRRIGQLVDELGLHFPSHTEFGQKEVEALFAIHGFDERGLTRLQRRYLRTLAGSARGVCSTKRLALTLGCDLRYLQDELEPLLFQQGLIDVDAGHRRELTAAGREAVAGFCDPPEGNADESEPTNREE